MIKLANTKECTACTACSNICPKEAIQFAEDSEGFLHPFIVADKCIECELCTKVCPPLNKSVVKSSTPKCYAAYSYNHQKNGSSGGMFSSVADYVLSKEGVVFGAAFDDGLQLRHIGVERQEDMQPLRGSKYLQSNLKSIFKEVKNLLKENRLVLFSGTPCQVDGLYAYLKRKEDKNLITIDLTCHGVPSQKAFDKWINAIEQKKGKVVSFQFRKLNGWSTLPKTNLKNGKKINLRYDLEAYMWAFYEGYLFRECCYTCSYANLNRPADITLADYWGIGNYGHKFKKSRTHGISLVLTNSLKGEEIVQCGSMMNLVYLEERELEEALHEQHNLKSPSHRPTNRDKSAKDFISSLSLYDYSKRYNLLPKSVLKYKAIATAKDFMINIGAFDLMKNLANRIKNRQL